MEEIKREILSLSEKYSIKCVESAALEEELRAANNQLAQAQHHIMQLDNRYLLLPLAHLIAPVVEKIDNIFCLEINNFELIFFPKRMARFKTKNCFNNWKNEPSK